MNKTTTLGEHAVTSLLAGNYPCESNLKLWLSGIEEAEKAGDYDKRNILVYAALSTATDEGLLAGIRIDPGEPQWPVVFIELPTGQVSWHVPQHLAPWDGHDTPTKYQRVRDFITSRVTS